MAGTIPIRGTGRKGSRKYARWAAAGILATVALAGCNARVRIDRKLWNLFSIEKALNEQGNVAICPTLPTGIPASDILTSNPAGALTLKVQPAFAQEKTAAFVTTEIWVNYYDAVWLQPLYVQFVAADPPTAVAGAPAVIDVGPDSSFYSPFWQTSWAVVGDVPADRYHSTKQLLDEASAIVPAGRKTCPLRPLDIVGSGLTLPPQWDAWSSSITLQTIPEGQAVGEQEGAVQNFGLFDFGANLYETEVEGHGAVVEALPMFVFARPDGSLAMDEPRVLGAGEVGADSAGRPRPRFGGLWLLYAAILPGSAGAFHAADHPAAAAAAGANAPDYEGRFALDASCFDGAAATFQRDCLWLDSQDKLESLLGDANLRATEIMQTGPLVLYDKQAVPVNN